MEEESKDIRLGEAKLTAVFCSVAAAIYAATQSEPAPATAYTLIGRIDEAPWVSPGPSGRMEFEMVTVKYDDLSMAFDFVSFAGPMEHRAYVSLDTGAIYWISETDPIEEDLPDDLETSDRYIAIPHKTELDLGNRLVLRFVEERLPHRYTDVVTFFRRRGAYARLKQLLAADGCLEEWYAFEAESTERALREWCEANEIHLAETGGQQSA